MRTPPSTVAVRMGLVELALQAVDGTKVKANAARKRGYDEKGLARLLERVEGAIEDLEAQNRTAGEERPAQLPVELSQAQALREKVLRALAKVRSEWDLLATAFNLRTLLKIWQLTSKQWKPALAIAG